MRTMIESGRSWLVALVIGVSLVAVGGAWAQSDTMKKEEMKKGDMKDGMAKDGMKKDDGMKGADKAMGSDGMKKGEMKKGDMKGDATMERKP